MRNEKGHFEEGNQAGGAPEDNTNSEVHGYWTEDPRFVRHLDDRQHEIWLTMVNELCERYVEVHDEKPNKFALMSIRNLVMDVIKREKFNEYVFEKDDLEFDNEERHRVYSRILNDYHKEMKELGLARDPESERDRAEGGWFELQNIKEENGEEPEKHRGYDKDNYED